jgi:Icc-related predicted phosphoesterase
LHAGDFSPHLQGEEMEGWFFGPFTRWLDNLIQRKIKVVIVPGNHDFICDGPDFLKTLFNWPTHIYTGVTFLINNWAIVRGLLIYGFPYINPIWGAFQASFDEQIDILGKNYYLDKTPPDIFLSHSPRYGIRDSLYDKVKRQYFNLGSKAIAHAIDINPPPVMVFGHIHENYGHDNFMGTEYISVSYVDNYNFSAYSPMVFYFDEETKEVSYG